MLPYSVHLEFRPDVYRGNVYTAYRSYIHDFGFIGLIILPTIFSICANWLYYAAVRVAKEKPIVVGLVIYATLIYPIFADFIRCFFYLKFFDINVLVSCIGVVLLRWFLFKMKWMKLKLI